MESLVEAKSFWRGKSVRITGHTGFKGSWLAVFLAKMGAEVHGFALPPVAEQNLYEALGLGNKIANSFLGDLCNNDYLDEVVEHAKPEIIFHLAAQPLVKQSYDEPYNTFMTNVMGTSSLL